MMGVVRTLGDAQYMPDLKNNLISLGTLDSKWYQIVLEGGCLKVLSGALVITRGKKENNVYFLQGGTVDGRASVSTEKVDSTRLWHMRLGHANESHAPLP